MLELPPLSLYIHIPWCIKKCPYCDFNSHEFSDALPETEYIAALCGDFDSDLRLIQNRPLQSIFIGGGTPSLFSASAFGNLLDHIRQRCEFSREIEITLEANPGTAEASKFRDYRNAGINRLSMGIQSFDDLQLQKLGRIHNSDEARSAITIARQGGFDNLNLDLMHGLPGQECGAAMADLETALAFEPAHISWYQLTIEPNTVFYSRPPSLPSEPVIDEIQDSGQQLLSSRGYQRYEVSAYSSPANQSIHNLNYWQFGDYIGIGAGAHGKCSFPEQQKVVRTRKLKQPGHYLQAGINREAEINEISREELPLEYLLNSLRTTSGFSVADFESRTGVPFSSIGKKVEYLVSSGLLKNKGQQITTTDKGFGLLNSVLQEFL